MIIPRGTLSLPINKGNSFSLVEIVLSFSFVGFEVQL